MTETQAATEVAKQTTQVVEFDPWEIAIAELQAEYSSLEIAGVDDKPGYEAVRQAIAQLRTTRTSLEGRRKEVLQESLDWQKTVNAEAKRITGLIKPLEESLKEKKQAVDDERERIKREAEEAKKARKDAHEKAIADIRAEVSGMIGKSSLEITAAIERVAAIDCSQENFEEYAEDAEHVRAHTLESLRRMRTETLEAEEAKRQLEKERQEREAQEAAENARRDAIRPARDRAAELLVSSIDASAATLGQIQIELARIETNPDGDEFDVQLSREVAAARVTVRERLQAAKDREELEALRAEREAEEARKKADEQPAGEPAVIGDHITTTDQVRTVDSDNIDLTAEDVEELPVVDEGEALERDKIAIASVCKTLDNISCADIALETATGRSVHKALIENIAEAIETSRRAFLEAEREVSE